jgi:hypothetical protein
MRSSAQILTETGKPTPLTRVIYTQSDCWLLAFELGLKLNAPLLALVDPDDPFDWDHVVVDLGRETVLDVEGLATRDEITRCWSKPLYPKVLRELGRHHSMDEYLIALDGLQVPVVPVPYEDMALARQVADALIALHLSGAVAV